MKYIYALILTIILSIPSWAVLKAESLENVPDLNPEDEKALLHMIEEEKLAHDVYQALYKQYNMPVFYNISLSEKRHMEAISDLLKTYNIENPCKSESGAFSKAEFSTLYDQLINTANESATKALLVGATIEDLDIADLDKMIARTENDQIKSVFENLNKGSRNHLRSFNDLLTQKGEKYTPQYLSASRYNEIVSSRMEFNGSHSKKRHHGVNSASCSGSKNKSSCNKKSSCKSLKTKN